MAEDGPSPRVTEATLAHVVANRVESAYARSGLFDRRRVLMDDRARYLDQGSGEVAPSTIPSSRAARWRAVRSGDNASRRRTALYPRGCRESVPTHVQCGFPGKASTTTARAAPSEGRSN